MVDYDNQIWHLCIRPSKFQCMPAICIHI